MRPRLPPGLIWAPTVGGEKKWKEELAKSIKPVDNVTILATADLHLNQDNLQESKKILEQLVKEAKDNKVDLVVVAGDILNKMQYKFSAAAFRLIERTVNQLSTFTRVVLIAGNHDIFLGHVAGAKRKKEVKNGGHPLAVLAKDNDNILFVDTPIWDHYYGLVYVPFTWGGHFIEYLRQSGYDPSDHKKKYAFPPRLIFAHQDFDGANQGYYEKEDYVPELSRVRETWKWDVPIFSGHFHDPQKVDNVTYLGTPYQWDYSPDPADHGFTLIKVRGTKITNSFISTSFPKRFLAKVDYKDLAEFLRKKIEGDVRVLLSVPQEESQKIFNNLDYLKLVQEYENVLVVFHE